MNIEPADVRFPAEAGACDFSFEVNAQALPPFDGPTIKATRPLPPHRKTYNRELPDYRLHTGTDDRALLTVRDDARLLGYVAISRKWNDLASVDDIAIDASARRAGAARKLIAASIDWAHSKGLRGVTAETQTNNLAACRFYENCGFTLGGSDRYLYAAIDAHQHETALFWYLMFSPNLSSEQA